MLGGGAPATFSQGGNPATYVPTAQPQMDQLFQSTIAGFPTQPGQTPAGQVYPGAQQLFGQFVTGQPGTSQFGNTQAILDTMGGANLAYQQGQAGAPLLQQAGQSILNTGFDPQQALFNRTQSQVLDQGNVANAMAGVASTPYGASGNANNLANFDINWQNNLLNREATAGQAGTALLNAAPTLAATSGATPFNAATGINNAALTGAGTLAQLGNNQFALPQQVLNDLQSYLQLGQAASAGALQGGNLGFNQTAQGIGGLVSGIGGVNNLLGGSGGGLLGGGGAGSALSSLGGTTLPGATALPDFAAGSIGGGADLGAIAAPSATLDAGASAGGAGSFLSALPFS